MNPLRSRTHLRKRGHPRGSGALALIPVSLLLTRAAAFAGCVGGFGGGGPPATDCIIAWLGVSSAITSCVDGTACDLDGRPDGSCAFALAACRGLEIDPSFRLGTRSRTRAKVMPARRPASAALRTAIEGLRPGQCTAPGFVVPVTRRAGIGPLRPGVIRLKTVITVDGRKDADRLRLVCRPAVPSFANAVQPVLTERCAYAGCHAGSFPAFDLDLSPGTAWAELVGMPSQEGGKLLRVRPGSIAKSFMARKIVGKGLRLANGSLMPQGCPGVPPLGGCLSDAERYAVLAWIQAGAPQQ